MFRRSADLIARFAAHVEQRDNSQGALTVIFILLVVFTSWTNAVSSEGPQTHFSAEDSSVRQPVPIPDGVLTLLREDEAVRTALASEGISPGSIPQSWFSASALHLSDSKDPDLIVMGEGVLRGSNVTTFWVFLASPSGYKLVLTAPANHLIVKSTRSKGRRDIELTSMTAAQISTVLLRFDGELYVKHSASSKAIE